MLQSDITQTYSNIFKIVLDKSFRIPEGRHTRPPYFFIGGDDEATSRRIQRPTTQGHSSHAKYENSRKIETYRNNHFQRIH